MTPPSRARLFLALGVLLAVNALASTRDMQVTPYVVPPLVLASVLLMAWRPLGAAALLTATTLIGGRLGVTPENGAVLWAWLPMLYVVGRRTAPASGAVVLVSAVLAVWVLDPTLPNLVFGVVLFGGAWVFGQVIQARAAKARLAACEHATLIAEDRDAAVEAVVVAERARLTADALTTIATAVDDMRRRADAARTHLTATEIASIGTRGAEAVGELRRMLGLLRSEKPARHSVEPPDRPPRHWWTDLAVTFGVLLLTLTDPFLTGAWEFRPGDLILCLPLVLRRTDPLLALVSATGLHATLLVLGEDPSMGFGGIAELLLLGWTVGTAASPTVWAAGAAFAGVALGHWWSAVPGNLPIGVVWVAGSAFAGWAWRDRDREYARARSAALALRNQRDAAVDEAVHAERLRLARDLHDVASHAVGVMVTQAGAAGALAPTDPDRARTALDIVESTARQALVELRLLGDILQVPAATGQSLADDLEALAERVRSTGTSVQLRLGRLPTDPAAEAVVHRTVQEALTNALRHAPGAAIDVTVEEHEHGHRVNVRNSVPMTAPDTTELGPGFGLVGVAERLRLLGGKLSTGPTADGGFAVEAELPRSAIEVAT